MEHRNPNKRATGVKEHSFSTPEAIRDFIGLPFITRGNIIESRISKAQLVQIKEVIDIDYIRLCRILGFHVRTFHAKNADDLFSPSITDNIVILVELYGFGYSQFSDPLTFNVWMKSINAYLNALAPLDHCHHFIGREEVKKEIIRIKEERGDLI